MQRHGRRYAFLQIQSKDCSFERWKLPGRGGYWQLEPPYI